MALILQVVAAVLTVLGAGTLYWGTSPSLLSLGNTIMVVGAVIAAAGILLFGLAAVLGQLVTLAQKLDDLRLAFGGNTVQPRAPAPAQAAVPARDEDIAEPSPFWREGLPEHPAEPAAPAAPAAASATIAPSAPVIAAPPPVASQPVAPPSVSPPTRQSLGLPPVGAAAALGVAAGVGAGLAASRSAEATPVAAARPAPEMSAEKPADPVEDVPEIVEAPKVPEIEPVLVEPSLAEPVVGDEIDADDAPALEADKPEKAEEPVVDTRALEESLAHAVEDLKEEVKAAEADLDPPVPAAETPAAPPADDHMASLEKLLLGEGPIRAARAPVDVDTDDFMERLRETISRPVAPPRQAPEPAPAEAAEPATEQQDDDLVADAEPSEGEAKVAEPAKAAETAPEPAAPAPVIPLRPAPAPVEPPRTEPAPALSIEEELEHALAASLAAEPIAAEPPPPPALPPAPPRPAPVVSIEPAGQPNRDAAMAALARDFPELNDLLAPRKPAATPADSLIADLKDIFEPAVKEPPPRHEPILAAPPPPPSQAVRPPLLREGVIAGIPFRLYGDGSIEADMEGATTHFASLKDFRAHVGG